MPPCRLFTTISSVMLVSSIAAHVRAAEPVASVIDFSAPDDVEIKKKSGKIRRPVKFGTIYEGETIFLEKDTAWLRVLFFRTKCFQTITGGSATLQSDSFSSGKTKITKGKCLPKEPEDLPESIGQLADIGAVVLRSGGADDNALPDAIQPIDDSSILTKSTLVFHWPATPDAKSYRIELKTPDGVRLWTATTEVNSVACSRSARKRIQSSFKYKWEVFVDDQPEPLYSGSFTLASADMVDDANAWMEIASDKDDVPLLLMAGAYFQHAHIYDKALGVYEQLVVLAPEQPAIYEGLSELLAQAGKTTEAKAAAERAKKLNDQPKNSTGE